MEHECVFTDFYVVTHYWCVANTLLVCCYTLLVCYTLFVCCYTLIYSYTLLFLFDLNPHAHESKVCVWTLSTSEVVTARLVGIRTRELRNSHTRVQCLKQWGIKLETTELITIAVLIRPIRSDNYITCTIFKHKTTFSTYKISWIVLYIKICRSLNQKFIYICILYLFWCIVELNNILNSTIFSEGEAKLLLACQIVQCRRN